LRKRGFDIKDESVEQYFKSYKGEWQITTCSKDEIWKIKDVDVLKQKLFAKDSMHYNFACTATSSSYDDFKNYDFSTVEASVLDPYIARFVHAINSVGVHTIMSCDGWHERRGEKNTVMKLWMYERYSVIWFWLIAECIFGETWNKEYRYYSETWRNKWEPDGDKKYFMVKGSRVVEETCLIKLVIDRYKENEIYERIDRYSKYIEENREQICRIREFMIQKIQDEELKGVGFLGTRKIMYEVVVGELEKLHDEWLRYESNYILQKQELDNTTKQRSVQTTKE
jgi:hypothetical protein